MMDYVKHKKIVKIEDNEKGPWLIVYTKLGKGGQET